MVSLEIHIKQGLKHLDVVKDRAVHCPICGSINFSIGGILDDWLSKPRRAFDLSHEDRTFLYDELIRRFKIPKNVCSLENHHISYVMEITMPLCIECHNKVHYSNEEPWCKYRPIDKKDDPKMYTLP